MQVRQDEQGPKFLQDVDPSSHQYGGGIVYVVDSATRELLASSWYTGQPALRRRFGIGYMSVVQNASSGAQQQQQRTAAVAVGSSGRACTLSQALGCYNDTDCPSCSAGPVLPVYQPQLHDKVTLPACASACHGLSYAVAGIDGGNHCWCGNASDLSSAGAKARARPAGECQVSSCHADPSEKCGGTGRLLAYSFVCDGPAPAPPAPTERGIGLQHELFVPFGDDPVVLSTVNVANSAQKSRNVSVITVWGTQMYQLQQCQETGGSCTSEQRRAFQRNHYTTATRLFYGPHDPDHAVSATTAASNVSAAQPTHWDATPPETFLSAVPSTPAAAAAAAAGDSVTFGCDAAAFYGAKGAASPAAKVACDPSGASDNGAMILERSVLLPAGGSITLHSVYGYAPSGFFVDKLIEKYGTAEAVNAARAGLGPAWMAATVGFNASGKPAVGREVRWNGGYVRQALTKYDFFNESVLDQGSQYRYGAGFEGAARDPLQHLLPLIHSAPERAASVLRMQLQTMVPPEAWGPPKPSGPFHPSNDTWNTAYALWGSGRVNDIDFGVILNGASDLEIYLLLASSEYLLATKNVEFLAERIPFKFKVSQSAVPDRSVLQAIVDAYRYLVNHTSTGQHGLMRVQSGDWNDGFSALAGCKDSACQIAVQAQGESIANSAMMTFVLERFAQALELCKVDKSVLDVAEVRAFAKAQTAAVRQYGWNGQWVNRAWLPQKGFVGTNAKGDHLGMTMEPQSWVLLSSMLNASEQSALLQSLGQLDCALSWKQSATGHMWVALNHPMVMGVAMVNKTLAWEKWMQSSLANEASLYPTLWPGVWTAADYISTGVGRSGGGAFPAFNTHRHAWPLFSLATSLVGIEFTRDGATIRPAGLPQDLGAFAFTSRLANVSRSDDGAFAGTLRPLHKTEACVVTVELPHTELTGAELRAVRLRVPRARLVGGEWLVAEAGEVVDGRGRWATRATMQGAGGMCGGEAGALEWQF